MTFDYDTIVIWGNDMWGFQMGNEFIAFIRDDQLVNERRIELRNKAREVVLRQPVRDLSTFRFTPDLKSIVIRDAAKELLRVQPIDDISTWQFEDAPLVIEEPEPEPEPPPEPPPVDIEPYRVIWPYGVNVRSGPDVNSTDIGDIAKGAVVNCNTAGFVVGEYPSNPFGWLEREGGGWVAFYKFGAGGRTDILAEYLVLDEDYTEPVPSSPTVQLAGPMKLETRANGYTYLKGGEGSGFNMRYMATGRYNPDEYLDFIAGNGFKWVRVYFSQERHTLQQNIDKFRVVLDKAAARNLLVCGVITDSLGHSGMIIEEDRPWHTGGGIGHLNIDWIMSKRYRVDYHRYVHGFASTFKDHPGLGMIDIVNEAGIYGANPITLTHAKAYIDWLAESAELAYDSCDGQRPIAFGGINSLHSLPPGKPIADHARELIMTCKHIQVWGPHFYSEKDYHPEALYRFEEDCVTYDYRFAKEAGKAIFGTEIGSWYTNNDRPLATRRVFERNQGKWNGGWYWGLALHSDNGEADAHAMARYRDGAAEFDGMLDAMKSFNNTTTMQAA